jgi:hypothetical protein
MKDPNKKPSLSVAVEHFVHLTKEQRYALHSGETIKCIGHNVPVWNDKGRTSEPAREVFCNYTLLNDKDSTITIKQHKDGYEINLPQLPPKYVPAPPVPLDLWRTWKPEDREKYSKKFKTPVSSISLLNIKDGGSEVLGFGQIDRANLNGTPVNLIHYVRIATRESLIESLV